jgi:SPP1 gp7 family putative phage head morphogenesis protein
MADTLAADMTNSNKIAASVINGYLPEVYAVNYNYGTYEIEKGSNINTQFTLYDRQTVERLLRDEPNLLPMKAKVNIPKDEQWNKKHINSAITQGILQGESIDKIAQRLAATVTDMSQTSAIRNARTMTTSAQNGGRIDSYKRAESMGIKMMQVWMSTLDSRTRHEHILLDGQKRKVGEPFEVDGEKIYFPGDPSAEPYLVYNCRCTLIGEVKGIDYKLSDTSQRDNKLGDMTYQEWKDSKRKQDEGEKPEPKKQEEQPKPTPQKEEKPAPKVEEPKPQEEPKKEPEKAKFEPARTKEEAVEYARRFADNVNYEGLSRSNANIINRTLTELTERYPINKLKYLRVQGSSVMSAACNQLNISRTQLGKTLKENYDNFVKSKEHNANSIDMLKLRFEGKKMPAAIADEITRLENELKFSRWAIFDSYDDKVRVAVIHEYGHIIADQYFGQINGKDANPNYAKDTKLREMVKKWDDAFIKALQNGDIYNLSRYGRTDAHEFFAECFAAREMGEKLPDYVESLMKEVLDNGIM